MSNTRIEILDNGYIELIDMWGSDQSIVEAARMSTNKEFKGWGTPENPGDEKLLAFLWRNNHATPFEMAGAQIEVKAPIFVFREWHRHRTQSYNEMSARYTPLPDENYMPSVERLISVNAGTTNKQAAGVDQKQVSEEDALAWMANLASAYGMAQRVYEQGLTLGIPKELARLPVPVSRYSRMRAQANLRNWLGFLTLRMAPNAQWEIRQYADALHKILSEIFPRTLSLFDEGRSKL